MWLMTTKGRPQAAKQVLDECWQMGMRQKAVMYVDGDPTGYDFKLPDNWQCIKGKASLAGSKQWVFKNFPDEGCYGWMADDNHPVTKHFSYYIEDVARPWKLVHCRDEWLSNKNELKRKQLYETGILSAGVCWGGDLVRCVGWWAPPNIIQASIDWTWTSLIQQSPLGVYLHNVTVKHDNWDSGRRAKDKTDEWGPHMKRDIATIRAFIKSAEFAKIKERIRREYLRAIS
jgi:hypothetical protein